MKVKAMRKNNFYLDSERLILAVKNRVRSYSATPLRQFTNNSVIVKELSNDLVTSILTIEDEKVFLVISSTLFPNQLKMFVGKVRKTDILLSDNHCLVAGLQVYKLCQMLVNNDEICVNPMSLFNISQHTEETEF